MAVPFMCVGSAAGTIPPFPLPDGSWICPAGIPSTQLPPPSALPPSAGETVAAGAPTVGPVAMPTGLPWGWILGGLAVGGTALYYLSK